MPDYQRLSLFPLNTVLFPGLSIPIQIFESRYKLMLKRCMETRSPFGVVLIQSGDEGSQEMLISTVGTTARITRCEPISDDVLLVEIEGETRFVINETSFAESYLTGSVTPFWEQRSDPLDLQPLYDQTVILFCNYLKSVLSEGNRHLAQLQLPTDPVVMSFAVAASLQTSLAEKQLLLELSSTAERLQQEILILQRGDIVPELVDTPLDEPFPVQTFEPLEASTVKENFSRN